MGNNLLAKNVKGYNYKYTDLAQIHEYLETQGMKYIQQVKRLDTEDYVFTKRYIDGKWEEEWLQGCRVVQATLKGINNPAQEQGSALTYARRYSVLMAFGLATTDDDAQMLSIKKNPSMEDVAQLVKNGQEEVTKSEKQGLIAKCKENDIVIESLLESIGWKQGEKITREQYGKAMNFLIEMDKEKKKND